MIIHLVQVLLVICEKSVKCTNLTAKQVMQPPPCPLKAVEPTTALSCSKSDQYTLLNRLSDAAKVQTKPSDDAMVIDEPAKPVAGSSKHPNNMDIIDSELIY